MVSKPKDVEVLTGPPGCGKSTRLRDDAIKLTGRYIFFLPTIPLINEQVAAFRAKAPTIELHEAHSGHGRGGVQRKLDDALAAVTASHAKHAVIFTTHDALMMRDLSAFTDWHARIDEAPNAAKSGTIDMSESWQWFDAYFDLIPVGTTGWSNLSLKGAAPNWTKVARDKLLKPLVDFIKLASSTGGVFVNTNLWSGVEKVQWWSIWTPASLKHFDTIQIAGASYHTSLGAIVAKKWFSGSINLIDTAVPMHRSRLPTIRVHFFTNSHQPSTTFWDGSDGRRMVKAVCDYLGANVPDLGYWSGNGDVLKLMEWRIAGERVQPKVAGQNRWRKLNKCAFIYSSGPTPEDWPLMEMFDITEEGVRRAREDEDILQFAMRGAIRNAKFEGDFDAYVYTEAQAETLAAQLSASGVGIVQTVPVPEAGIMNETFAERSRAGRTSPASPAPPKSPVQKVFNPATKKMVLPRSLARASQRAEADKGKIKKPRGRPPKVNSPGFP